MMTLLKFLVIDLTGGLLGERSINDIMALTQGGAVKEWTEVKNNQIYGTKISKGLSSEDD